MSSGDDQWEVADGEGVDDLRADTIRGSGSGHLRSVQLDGSIHAEDARDGEHVDTGNGCGHDKDADGKHQQLAHPLRIRDVRNGAGDGKEDQRHQQNEQQVQPDLTDGIQDRRLFSQGQAQNGADNDECNEDQRFPVRRFLFFSLCTHRVSLHIFFIFPLNHIIIV